MAVLTNENGAVLTSGGKAYTSGYRPKEWHLLVDYTTTEAVRVVAFKQGDNGEVFNDYDELFVCMFLQPTSAETRVIALSLTSGTPWGGGYLSNGNSSYTIPSASDKTNLIHARYYKTPLGIMESNGTSINRSSYNAFIYAQSNNATGSSSLGSNLPMGQNWTPEQMTPPIFKAVEFKMVSIGCYTGTPIEANCKFIIYGLK